MFQILLADMPCPGPGETHEVVKGAQSREPRATEVPMRILFHLIDTLAGLIGEAPPRYRGLALLLFASAVSLILIRLAWSISVRL